MSVVGVDGYRRGWVAVVLENGRFAGARTARTFREVREQFAEVDTIAVDIPIGLAEVPRRRADAAAQEFLGLRRNAVFDTYPADVYRSSGGSHRERYAAARAYCRARGWSVISSQSFALGARILELDEWASDPLVIEVHPEVSFRELAGQDLGDKKTWNGVMARHRALRAAGIDIPESVPSAAGVPADDLLDAAVSAWSAERYARGVAEPLPAEHPRRLPGAIWR